ncbi:MAG: malonyl-CoA decarboxylase family protein, partial [Pseudomonadota bacterium]
DPHTATTAVFYSINNCQVGLRGISFGHFLIKQVAQDLAREMANLKSFSTLSPLPVFAAWLRDAASRGDPVLSDVRETVAPLLEGNAWHDDPGAAKAAEAVLMPLAAHYLTEARDGKGRLLDPVARFHLGNGARLEEINWSADRGARGRAASFGIMVNYAYVLSEVEDNHEAFINDGTVAVSQNVQRLAREAVPSGVPASAS